MFVFWFDWQQSCSGDVYSDTDWAVCSRNRKSTTGGCLMIGRHFIKSWSSTQPSIALSSGEAEMVGATKAAAAAIGALQQERLVDQRRHLRLGPAPGEAGGHALQPEHLLGAGRHLRRLGAGAVGTP